MVSYLSDSVDRLHIAIRNCNGWTEAFLNAYRYFIKHHWLYIWVLCFKDLKGATRAVRYIFYVLCSQILVHSLQFLRKSYFTNIFIIMFLNFISELHYSGRLWCYLMNWWTAILPPDQTLKTSTYSEESPAGMVYLTFHLKTSWRIQII
jgi:hypothetical protein